MLVTFTLGNGASLALVISDIQGVQEIKEGSDYGAKIIMKSGEMHWIVESYRKAYVIFKNALERAHLRKQYG